MIHYRYQQTQTAQSGQFQRSLRHQETDRGVSDESFDFQNYSKEEPSFPTYPPRFSKGDRVRRINSGSQNPLMVHSRWYDNRKGCWMYRCGCGYVIEGGNLDRV